jgi:hypothetical protein
MTPNENEPKTTPSPSKRAFAPEGTSELPDTLPDFPSPGTTDPAGSPPTTGR